MYQLTPDAVCVKKAGLSESRLCKLIQTRSARHVDGSCFMNIFSFPSLLFQWQQHARPRRERRNIVLYEIS